MMKNTNGKMPLIWSVALLVVIGPMTIYADYGCPRSINNTGTPRFTKELGQLDFVRFSHSKQLDCCAGGVDSILWYKKEHGIWKSYPSSMKESEGYLIHSNQSLLIRYADVSDNTSFKCALMKDGVSVKENIVRLYVIICDHLAEGPKLTAPFPVSRTIDKLGVDVTFPCTGYFGCNDEGSFDRFIIWRVEGIWSENISSVDSRYTTKSWQSLDQVTLQSNLTIKSVSAVDLNRTFVCQLVTPQVIEGQTKREVRIFKRDPPIHYWWYIVIAGGGAIMLIILFLVIRLCYGPQIRVYMGTRMKIFPPWPISAEDLEHNAFLYHADDDVETACDMKKKLEEYGLKIKISDDLPKNQLSFSPVEEGIKNSALILFLYSQNLVEDPQAIFVIEGLLQDSQKKSLVFIQIEKDTAARKFDPDFWKNVQKLKYPSKNASGRQQKHFLCTLVKQIPKFKKQEVRQRNLKHDAQKVKRQTSSSSAKPLLETPLPSPAPLLAEVQGNTDITAVTVEPTAFPYKGLESADHRNGHVEGRYWDDFEASRNDAGTVSVDVHHSGDIQVSGPGDIQVSDPGDIQVSAEGQVDQVGESSTGASMIGQGEPVRRTLSAQSSQSDNRSSGVFELSQEGGYQSMESGTARTGLDIYTREDETDPHHNVTGRKDGNESEVYGLDQTSKHRNQNPNLRVDIKGTGSYNSCSSPETGYTSMSPERQRDLEQSFEMSNSNVPLPVNN